MKHRYIAKIRPRTGKLVGAWKPVGTFANYADAEDACRDFERHGCDVYIGFVHREKSSKLAQAFMMDFNAPLPK